MILKTKYITLDEFKEYFGVDLQYQLNPDDNESNTAIAFLKRIEDRLDIYLKAEYHRNIDREYQTFSEEQKENYKLALLEQAMYIFKSGDISTDSGYDQERGKVADVNYLKEIAISPVAKQYLMNCGLLTRHLKSKGRGILNDYWWH